MNWQDHSFHFIGVGGIGMCGLAEILHGLGAKVSGSDLSANTQVDRLKSIGIQTYSEHRAENIGDADVVVYSSAIPAANPEIVEATKRKITLIRRAEALAEIMRLKRGLAIAGTHGKTTTTSLISSVFIAAERDPTVIVGGRVSLLGATARLGQGNWVVAEADESDGSFHHLSPEVVIVTNIDNDHLDHYGSMKNLEEAFYRFAAQIPFYGLVIACGDNDIVRKVFERFPKRIKYYGFGKDNDYSLKENKNGNYSISSRSGEEIVSFNSPLPGRYNALNSMAALIAAKETGADLARAKKGVEEFSGVDRRSQFKGSFSGIDVYDDYGHHPTEIRAVLNGFREKFSGRRLVVYFQLHRYSRTQICWDDFLSCFSEIFETCFSEQDLLFLGDIYPAGESSLEGITAIKMVEQISHPRCEYTGTIKESTEKIDSILQKGDVLLTLGAGDSWKVGQSILDARA